MTRDGAVILAITEIVSSGEDADQILLGAIAVLADSYSIGVGIRFVEEGSLSDGPWAGARGTPVSTVPVQYGGELVAEIVTAGTIDDVTRRTWEHVGVLIADYCLVGWDIGGEDWEP